MPKKCCTTSVGVLILSEDRTEMLLIERATPPAGIAPVAGHALDEHASYEDAARKEVEEEIGLEVSGLTLLRPCGFHPGRCRRTGSAGHDWRLYEATVNHTDVSASAREVADVGWWSLEEIQRLAERTVDRAAGLIRPRDFELCPGLEPVWCHWLTELGYISLPAQERAWVRDLSAIPPLNH